MPMARLVVAVAVINSPRRLRSYITLVILILAIGQAGFVHATVLPEERADLMFHDYDGGGVTINGPSLLVRKNASTNTSVFYNYYVDHISSASLDVKVGGSPYQEHRTEQSGGFDYVHGKTLMGMSYTNSVENDYKSNTVSFNMSQDFFGDLSTLTMGYSRGQDNVTQRGLPYDLSEITRQNYRLGFSQVLSKNFVVRANWETISDEAVSLTSAGVTLNNPYRSYSYYQTATTRGYDQEKYPATRTSNALAISGSYYLPFHAAIHGQVKLFQDSWGINATTYQLGYTYPLADWTFDFRTRWYSQSRADFYRDIFARQDEYTFMARDRELSTFQDVTIGVTASMAFAKNGWHWVDKGSLNLSWDHIEFNYKDYRNVTAGGAAGTEPLYSYGADVFQFYVSIWY